MRSKFYTIIITSTILSFTGCNEVPSIPQPHVPSNKSNFITPEDENLSKPLDTNKTIVKQTIPKPIHKKPIKLKKVEDSNFSPEYMYPTDTKQEQSIEKEKIQQNTTMTIDECIALIGQERFDKYKQILGSKSLALKRCQMIK